MHKAVYATLMLPILVGDSAPSYMQDKSEAKGPSSGRKRSAKAEAESTYHVSIAVIKRRAEAQPFDDKKPLYDYLVLQDDSESYHFLDLINRAIGASFDLTAMTDRIVERFGLMDREFVSREFFRRSKSDPDATAYTFLLSAGQEKTIIEKLQSGEFEGKWVAETSLGDYKKHWRKRQLFLLERTSDAFSQPKFPADLRVSIKNIVKAKNSGRLIVFAGAGVSIDSNVPGWRSLLKELGIDLGTEVLSDDPLVIPQEYFDKRKNKEYQERVQEILNHPHSRYNPLHQLILELQPQHIITTNFDPHFEQAITESSAAYSTVKKDSDLPYAKGASLLVKMHGDFGERNIVLTQADYDQYEEQHPLITSFVKYAFSSSLVLFVGFSGTDLNLKQILGTVQKILGANHQRPYLVTFRREDQKSSNSAQQSGSRDESIEEQVHEVLVEPDSVEHYYEQVKQAQDERRIEHLSKTGQRLYKFLKVVQQFDLSSDAFEHMDAATQLERSLMRFNEFGAIPIEVLEKLVPLRLKSQPKYSDSGDADFSAYEYFCLRSKNDELLQYLKSRSRDGVVTFAQSKKDNSRPTDDALRLLYTSTIRSIARASDTNPDVYDLRPNSTEDTCSCMGCRYRRLEFAELLQDAETLATKSISSSEQADLGLKEAWAFMKIGQPVRSYYALEEVRIRAQKTHRHVTHFLACLNLRNLRPFLRHQPNTSWKELEQIREAIDAIDLDKILYELPVDPDIKKALSQFRSGRPIDDVRWQLREELEKIREIQLGYAKGGYRIMSGPLHWFKAESSVFILFNLLRGNHLLDDEYGDFARVIHDYLDCMMTSWATSDEYKQRPKELSEFFALMFTEYGDTKALGQRMSALGLGGLALEPNARTKAIDRFKRFLRSGFERQRFFGSDILKRQIFERASESDIFARRVRTLIDNHMLLFSSMDWTEEEAKEILGLVLDFLSVSDCFGGAGSHKPFLRFVDAIAGELGAEELERLIDYALADHVWTKDLLTKVSRTITAAQPGFKARAGLYERIQSRSKQQKWRTRLDEMMPLYPFLSSEEQIRMKKDLDLHNTAENERTRLIAEAYRCGIWNPILDQDTWNIFCEMLSREIQWLKDHYIPDDGDPKDIENLGPWNGMWSLVRIVNEHDMASSKECQLVLDHLKSRMFIWALRPEDFDYTNFDYRWLLAFEDWHLDCMMWPAAMITKVEDELRRVFVPDVARALYRHIALQA